MVRKKRKKKAKKGDGKYSHSSSHTPTPTLCRETQSMNNLLRPQTLLMCICYTSSYLTLWLEICVKVRCQVSATNSAINVVTLLFNLLRVYGLSSTVNVNTIHMLMDLT